MPGTASSVICATVAAQVWLGRWHDSLRFCFGNSWLVLQCNKQVKPSHSVHLANLQLVPSSCAEALCLFCTSCTGLLLQHGSTCYLFIISFTVVATQDFTSSPSDSDLLVELQFVQCSCQQFQAEKFKVSCDRCFSNCISSKASTHAAATHCSADQ